MPLSEEVKVTLFDHKDPAVKQALLELAPKIDQIFDASETEFARNKSKLNTESQALRKYKIATENFARLNGIEKLDDPEGFLSEIQSKLKGSTEKNNSVEQQLKLITKKLEDQEKETLSAKRKAAEASVKSKASADFNKMLHAPNMHLSQAIAEGLMVGDDNETLMWKVGDDYVDYSKGLATYIAKHKEDAKNIQQPGANSTKGKKGSGSSKQEATLTQAEFDAMEPRERAKYAKENPGWSISG